MPRVIAFDVNETLLDLKAMDAQFERVFRTAGVRQEWFKQVLQSALLTTILDAYADFGAVGAAALEMAAAVHDVPLTEDDRKAILGAMRELPPHPEAPDSLRRLHEAGLRLCALTNSTQAVAEAQLEHAGLARYFERILSVDTVRRLKPHAAVYQMAARECGVEPGGLRLVAVHSWDIAGALRAGCAAAFVARPGMVLDPLFGQPDIVAADLAAVADLILGGEGSGKPAVEAEPARDTAALVTATRRLAHPATREGIDQMSTGDLGRLNIAENADGSLASVALLRWALVIIFLWFGGMKFTAYEANGIAPFIANGPFMSWLHAVFGIQGASYVIGIVELSTAAALIIGAFNAFFLRWGRRCPR